MVQGNAGQASQGMSRADTEDWLRNIVSASKRKITYSERYMYSGLPKVLEEV